MHNLIPNKLCQNCYFVSNSSPTGSGNFIMGGRIVIFGLAAHFPVILITNQGSKGLEDIPPGLASLPQPLGSENKIHLFLIMKTTLPFALQQTCRNRDRACKCCTRLGCH